MNMERNKYYDFLRGIAIIMVIGIHTFIGGNFETTFGIINTIIRNIFNCAVPIFLAISGYFLYNKKLETIKECTCFWKKQIPKIYIPCLLYSLWYFLISIKGGENPIIAIILLFTCGFSVYYFIALITQYYLLLPVLRNINMGGVIISLITSLICVTIVAMTNYVYCIDTPLIIYAGFFPLWIIFFVLGIYIRKKQPKINLILLSSIAIFALVAEILENHFYYSNFSGGFGIKPTSFIFSIAIILLLFSKNCEKSYSNTSIINRAICAIGENSFVIYLTHCTIINIMYRWLPLNWFLRIIVVLVSNYILIIIAKHIIPKRIIKYFGIV